jgi:DNA invertase Pin-like site-specific DNA recombinase
MPSQPLKVLLICGSSTRWCSGMPASENPLQDQEVRLRDWLSQNVSTAMDVHVLVIQRDRRSGNAILEPCLKELRQGFDLVLVESLGCIGWGFDVYRFLELAMGHNTRIVAIADSFDSSTPHLSLAMMLIGCRYGFDYEVTQRRIRYHRRRRSI